MSTTRPEIRIYFSWLLYERVSREICGTHPDGTPDIAPWSKCFEWAEAYRQEWAKYQDKILPALCEATGLSFYRQTIDVACAPWLTAQSDPVLMSFYYEPDRFVDMLTHELCHVLLTDNDIYAEHSAPRWLNLAERWQKLYGTHDDNTLVHIPVHALLKHIALDVLHEPSRVDRDVADCKGNKPYKDSWEYVNTHDYHEIIESLRADYQALGVIMKA